MSENNSDKAPHILTTSSNMLGLCFIVVTSLKALNVTHKSIIDEITTVAIFLFMTSAILSFLSIRKKSKRSYRFENIADYTFLSGMIVMFLTAVLLTFNVIL